MIQKDSEEIRQDESILELTEIIPYTEDVAVKDVWPFLTSYGVNMKFKYTACFMMNTINISFSAGINIFNTEHEKKWNKYSFMGNILVIHQSLFSTDAVLIRDRCFRPLLQGGNKEKERIERFDCYTGFRTLTEIEKNRVRDVIRWLESSVCYKQTFCYALILSKESLSVIFFRPELQTQSVIFNALEEAFRKYPFINSYRQIMY